MHSMASEPGMYEIFSLIIKLECYLINASGGGKTPMGGDNNVSILYTIKIVKWVVRHVAYVFDGWIVRSTREFFVLNSLSF